MKKPLVGPFLTILVTFSTSAQNIEASFSTEKANYLVGEPVFVILLVGNKTSETIWLDFKVTDFPSPCNDFDLEVPGAKLAGDWGCGSAASCAGGFREVQPGKSIVIQRLVNRDFRMRQPGPYQLHADAVVSVHRQNLFDSPEVDKVDVAESLAVRLRDATEKQLKEVFQPYVHALNSSEDMRRGSAAQAITELAPPFLEDVLIELTKTNYAYAAITALRKANTTKTRAALAQIATSSDDPVARIEAIQNLGRASDTTYLPTLVKLMESENKQIQNVAAEAVGNLGGVATVRQLSTLVSDSDAETRSRSKRAGADTRTRSRTNPH